MNVQTATLAPSGLLRRRSSVAESGFTLLETLVGLTILAMILLTCATIMLLGYQTVDRGGQRSMIMASGRQIIEDLRSIDFDNLPQFNGFDTNSLGTIPAADPEREIARRLRYALAGEGGGWTFTAIEKSRWTTYTTAGLAERAQIVVTDLSPTLREVEITITMSMPGWTKNVKVATIITKLG